MVIENFAVNAQERLIDPGPQHGKGSPLFVGEGQTEHGDGVKRVISLESLRSHKRSDSKPS